ncbi:MAG: alanine--glyoxylate aminotransferase family protein [Tissierellia bacterium]|nr:alanine--glyoxylate aminotransferase family protein [Tissierellia bacterium]
MKLMCAGPTAVRQKSMEAMGKFLTNPDLDPAYTRFHRKVEEKYSQLLHTQCRSIIMLGEAIMGLEAAVVNLMEKNDRVLVLSNGFFGAGFMDYVESYGGQGTLYEIGYDHSFNLKELEAFIDANGPFRLATMVHCETPTGISNDIAAICALLKSKGMMTIVDGVSSVMGEQIDFDAAGCDILIGGTQKAISAPTGLTLLTLSQRAEDKIHQREEITGYYLNLKNYLAYPGDFDFPYTMNENLVYALDAALDEIATTDFAAIHEQFASAVRQAVQESGLELYPKEAYSNTLTAVLLPEALKAPDFMERLKAEGYLISGSMGELKDTVIRIGHMGNNNHYEDFVELFTAMDKVFQDMGHKLNGPLAENFKKAFQK